LYADKQRRDAVTVFDERGMTTMRTIRFAGMLAFVSLFAAPAASAVSLNPNGLGQLLIYPYYTVNKDQDTLISIVNASDTAKVLQVFVLEGYNARTVLDFTVLLSAHDVWTAAITQTAEDGGGILRTSDTSCTYPAIPAGGVTFRASGYDGTGPVPADTGPQGITRTREGYIAVVARGDAAPESPLEQAITHVQNGAPGAGIPADCASLSASFIGPDVIAPTNGINGSGTIINVGQGTFFAYNAEAIANYSDIALYSPAASLFQPYVDANSAEATSGVARSYSLDTNGQPVVADWAFGVDAVSAVLMADSIQNEYLLSTTLGASTDWVVTFPTKHMYVDDLFGDVPFPPFAEAFHAPGISRIVTVANHYDREEGATQQPPVCDSSLCPAPPIFYLAYEVNVLSYVAGSSVAFTSGTPSRVLGSTLTYSAFDPNGTSGFTQLDLYSGDAGHELPGGIAPNGDPLTMLGLPATGFMVYNIINTDAQPGLLANYGGLFQHKATTACVGATPCSD
jgi:hypothetical protein